MSQKRRILYLILPLSLILLLIGLFGCDGSSDVVNPPTTATYALNGALVVDINAEATEDTSFVAVQFERNGSSLTDAVVSLGSDTLVFEADSCLIDSVYSFESSPMSLWSTGAYLLVALDGDDFGDTIGVMVPDTFSISFYTGDSTVPNVGGQEMQINWTGSANSEGYVVAVVKEDLVGSGQGYSAYVTTQGTQATIPPDAFRETDGDLIAGTYHIFIYSFAGSPDSAFAGIYLPVPLPSQLPDNIDHDDLDGRFGSVIVTRRVIKVVEAG